MRSPFAAYNRRFLTAVAVVMGVGVGLHLLTDPFGAFGLIDRPWLRRHRAYETRTGKAEALARGGFQVIIVGNSRVEVGIDPEDAALGGRSAFNLGLAGAAAEEVLTALSFALEHNSGAEIVLFADALLSGAALRADFALSRFNPQLSGLEYRVALLLGRPDAAVRSLVRALTLDRPKCTERGFLPRDTDRTAPPRRTFLRDFRDAPTRRPIGFLPPGPSIARAAAVCRAAGSRLTIVFPPVHALYVERAYVSADPTVFEQWKRALVRAVECEPPCGGSPITLWDFSGWTGPMIEPVPVDDRPESTMRWYIEASHFRPELGSLLLVRIFAAPAAGGDPGADFGVRLTSANLEAHLARQRADRRLFLRQRAADLAAVGLDE